MLPRLEIKKLDSVQLAALVKPQITKSNYENLVKEKARSMAEQLRLEMVGGLQGTITSSIKDIKTLNHLKLIFDNKEVESWDWWILLFHLIIVGHFDEAEISLSRIIQQLEDAIKKPGTPYKRTYVESVAKGNNTPHAQDFLSSLHHILEPTEDLVLDETIKKWLLKEHSVGKDGNTKIYLIGRNTEVDNLRAKLHKDKKLTWRGLRKAVMDSAQRKDGAHTALVYDGEIENLREDILATEKAKQRREDERKQAFETLKLATASCLKLHFFDPTRQIYIASDASKKGWGGIIFYLNDDGTKDIVGVASGSFNDTEQKWSTNEHEAKAIHNTLLAFRNYLLGREFILFTDNRNLTFLNSNKSDKVHRWMCDFAQFAFKAYHIPGKFNWETDFLSRILTEKNAPTVVKFFNDR